MILKRVQAAPYGSTYALTAFDDALGRPHPILLGGEVIGTATLIGAIPGERRITVTLYWEVDELVGEHWGDEGLWIDEFVPPNAYNPARALQKVREVRR